MGWLISIQKLLLSPLAASAEYLGVVFLEPLVVRAEKRAHALVTTRCVVNCVYFLIDSKMVIKKIWTAVEIFKWPRGSPFKYHRKQQPDLQMLGAAFRELSQNFFFTLVRILLAQLVLRRTRHYWAQVVLKTASILCLKIFFMACPLDLLLLLT